MGPGIKEQKTLKARSWSLHGQGNRAGARKILWTIIIGEDTEGFCAEQQLIGSHFRRITVDTGLRVYSRRQQWSQPDWTKATAVWKREMTGACSSREWAGLVRTDRLLGKLWISIFAGGWDVGYERKKESAVTLLFSSWANGKLEVPFGAMEMTLGRAGMLLPYWSC